MAVTRDVVRITGRAGETARRISTAQSWFGDWQTSATIIADPEHDATWTAMPVPKVGGGSAIGAVRMNASTMYAMNAKFAHPEAYLKIELLTTQEHEPDANGNDPYHTLVTDSGERITTFFYKNDFFGTFGMPGYNEAVQKLVTEALAKRDPSILPNPESVGYYNRAVTWLDSKEPDGYKPYSTFGPSGGMAVSNYIYENDLYRLDEFYGSNTPAMNDYMGDLRSQRLEIWSRIIFGDVSVDEGWKQWIDYWNAQGGQEITAEANEWWKTFGRK
jgi:putative aldouronate transport system substrate-binding protein